MKGSGEAHWRPSFAAPTNAAMLVDCPSRCCHRLRNTAMSCAVSQNILRGLLLQLPSIHLPARAFRILSFPGLQPQPAVSYHLVKAFNHEQVRGYGYGPCGGGQGTTV